MGGKRRLPEKTRGDVREHRDRRASPPGPVLAQAIAADAPGVNVVVRVPTEGMTTKNVREELSEHCNVFSTSHKRVRRSLYLVHLTENGMLVIRLLQHMLREYASSTECGSWRFERTLPVLQ